MYSNPGTREIYGVIENVYCTTEHNSDTLLYRFLYFFWKLTNAGVKVIHLLETLLFKLILVLRIKLYYFNLNNTAHISVVSVENTEAQLTSPLDRPTHC